MLLERGARIDHRSADGLTALHVAAEKHFGPDDESFLMQLLDAGADINATDEDGRTPLMAVATGGYVNKVKALLGRGARVTTKDRRGRTALDYARPRRGNDYERPHCSEWSTDSDRPSNCVLTRLILKQALAASAR